ncbi:amino acid adenylation domain-containing protein [Microcoleus sp. herbarium2]|uniref:amino acid adenylation domain-containing protein n=1 Tax=Microcoleus sp. herbarium2 TaxID=3055433 RepID=UPI002FD007E8
MYTQNPFSCFLIGEGTLPIQCGELLLKQGHKIFGVISSDASISNWAKGKDIPHIQQTDNLVAFLSQQPFDYLFSIVNSSILPKEVFELPRLLAINYHDSLLPRYAGVSATSWALMNGEKTHGVTWHVMAATVDSGDILKQISVEINSDETAFTLNGKCYEAAICSFAQLIDELTSGQVLVKKQNPDERTYFERYKRPRSGGVFSFHSCAHDIDAFVRALDFGSYLNPLGLAKLVVGNNSIVVSKLEVLDDQSKSPPGTVTAIEPSFLKVSTASYSVALHQVLTISGQVLPIPDFVERFGLHIGYRFKDIEPDGVSRIERFDALIAKHEAFWVERLKRLQPITIPYAQSTVSHLDSKQYASVKIPISYEITTFLEKRHPAWNLGDFLEAAFATYLARIGGTGCFDIGFRDVKLQQEMLGLENLFASHVPCRVNIGYEQSFEEVFEDFSKQVKLTKLHLTYARDLVRRYPALRSLSQVNCEQMFPVIVERVEKLDNYQAEHGNELTLVIASDGKECFWFYNTEALDGESIARMQDQFAIFLGGIVTDSAPCVAEIPLLSDQERHKILVDWNDTQADYPKDKCIHQLFEAQVEQTPDAVAVVFEDEQLTYKELNKRANQLAHHLGNLGVGPEVLVGICVERSLEMIVGLLGVLKAGGAYVPLDPAYPSERLAFMLEDSQVAVLLTQARLVESIPKHQGHIVCLDTDWEIIERQSKDNPKCSFTPDNLAYVIYTSGSTGKPKGVLVAHSGVSNLGKALIQVCDVQPNSRVLQFCSLSFDGSVTELVMALLSGGTMVMGRRDSMLPGPNLIQLLRDFAVTTVALPPSALAVLPADELPALRTIIVAGEACSQDLVARWSSGRRFFNGYGPTECSVCTTMIECIDSKEAPPIGRPLPNTQVYILDAQKQPVPIGVPGELYIGGVGVTRGYLNRPELSADRFILNPFSNDSGSRLYRTGDLVRYLPDGNIEFLGRIDHQVKIRGFRIELGEIEAVLRQNRAVQNAVVVGQEYGLNDKRLVAYVVPTQEQAFSTSELRRYLKQKLPDHMVPSAFVRLEALPLTPNEKVDRRALPMPNRIRSVEETFAPPLTFFEEVLADIWSEVLRLDSVGIHDNFFELGGHSLLAVRVLAQIEKTFGKNLPLATLFQSPTIKQLANILRQKGWSAPCESLVVIQSGGSKRPLFFIHVLGEGLNLCRSLTSHLDPEQPIYGLAVGIMDEVSLNKVEDVVAHYIKEMRSIQPEGPYLLAGIYCGGRVAYEMAQQLDEQGQKVALLALLDSLRDGEAIKIIPVKERVLAHWSNFLRAGPAYLLSKRRLGEALGDAKNWLMSIYCKFYERLGLPLPQVCQTFTYPKRENEVNEVSIEWVFAPKGVYPDRVTLFRAIENIGFIAPDLGWSELAPGGLEIHDVPGDTFSMLQEPHVQGLAKKLTDSIDRVQEDNLADIPALEGVANLAKNLV